MTVTGSEAVAVTGSEAAVVTGSAVGAVTGDAAGAGTGSGEASPGTGISREGADPEIGTGKQ